MLPGEVRHAEETGAPAAPLNRDEGLGVQALKLLSAQLGDQTPFELLDGGVLGLNLLMVVEDCSHLLLLDAVNVGITQGRDPALCRCEAFSTSDHLSRGPGAGEYQRLSARAPSSHRDPT